MVTSSMAEENPSFGEVYTFTLLSKTFTFQQDPKITQLLMKWSMLGRISTQAFSFDQPFQSYRWKDFAWNFFQDPCVKSSLQVLDSSGSFWTLLGKDITHVNAEVIPCTKVTADIFDPIYSSGILRPSGHIVKCYHETHPDFDELRMILLEEDSDNYPKISASHRQEFLFRLFKHVVLGGELCQYEDVVEPYIDTAKTIYKDMVSVQKNPDTKDISVVSAVLKVSACDDCGLCYPAAREHEQTFAYLCIDPFKRHVYVLYHSFGIGNMCPC